jgi:hypothetical protein
VSVYLISVKCDVEMTNSVYYLDPFKYLLGALLSFTTWNEGVECTEEEYGRFDPPDGSTCGEYMMGFLQSPDSTGYLANPVSRNACVVVNSRTGDRLTCEGRLERLSILWIPRWPRIPRRFEPRKAGLRLERCLHHSVS